MSNSSIRLVKTPEIERVIAYLSDRYQLLSESEIIKLALSEMYKRIQEEALGRESRLQQAFYHAIEEGGKVGDELIAKEGLNRDNLSEQEIYDRFLDKHPSH